LRTEEKGVLNSYFSKICAHKKYKGQRDRTGVDNEKFRDLSTTR